MMFRRFRLKYIKFRLLFDLSRMDVTDPLFSFALTMFLRWCEENDI